jgi:hypothetical protein
MNELQSGIFIRGKLIGTKTDSNKSKVSGEVFPYTALGINVPMTNSFGIKTFITKEIVISKDKLNDAAFMKSVNDNFEQFVEIEIGVGNFKQMYVPFTSVLTVLKDVS